MRVRRGTLRAWITSAAMLVLASTRPMATAPNIHIDALSPTNQTVGTTLLFGASGTDTTLPLQYRYSVRPLDGEFQIVREFLEWRTFEWTPMVEGIHEIKVTARKPWTGEITESSLFYRVSPRSTNGIPTVSDSGHPLVALYSAPACAGSVRVRFRQASSAAWQYTPWRVCQSGRTNNEYVAGMLGQTTYYLQQENVSSSSGLSRGPILPFQTGTPSKEIPSLRILTPAGAQSSQSDGIVLHLVHLGSTFLYPIPFATDLAGRTVWYYDRLTTEAHFGTYTPRIFPGGRLMLIVKNGPLVGQILREIDLAGNTVRETSLGFVREQLIRGGFLDPTRYFAGAFHHEVTRLPNGHTLAFVSLEQMVEGTDYLGDMVVDLDENLQVAWAFNEFEHLPSPPTHPSPLGEACSSPMDGCPTRMVLAPRAYDWTHSNTIFYLPAEGNLLVSMRNLDQIIKIDYRDGAGTGAVLWTLGIGHDFQLENPLSDPSPWFSHQHDVSLDGDRLLLYDNGNEREATGGGAVSRGQLWRIDQNAMTVRLELNVPLSVYSGAFGAAERLTNGNYHFGSGYLTGTISRATEVTPDGRVVFEMEVDGLAYRSYRLRNMYAP